MSIRGSGSWRSWPSAGRLAPGIVLAVFAAVPSAAAASPGPGGSEAGGSAPPGAWLDTQSVPNWNNQHGGLPKADTRGSDALPGGPCAEQILEPTGREDKAVSDAGWSVVSEPQSRAGTVVVTAATGADGMCRPLGVQGFVFLDGRFAGTLSPHPMDSRTDGILGRVQLFGATLRADFRRYSATDPLCCPSRTSTVSYRLETSADGPVLVPSGVETVRTPPTHK